MLGSRPRLPASHNGRVTRTDLPLPRVNGDFLVRPRLLDLLDRWSPISLLLAPSGAGKAVLAVQWAAHARAEGHDVIWVDGEVDEPADVVAALARYAGVTADPDDRVTLRRLRRGLQGRDRRMALVVNNAEPIVEAIGPGLVEIVRDCREVHLVLCLRRRLDAVAKALLEAESRVLGLGDLQFTTEEVGALAEQFGLALSPDEAEAIRASVGGWAALVRTGLESLPDLEQQQVTVWSPRHVAWFVGANIEPILPPSALAALCRTALVEQPTYGAVLAATGPLDGPARAALEDIGILDPLVSEGEPLVRMPPAMRDHFAARYDVGRLGSVAAVHQRVARYWLGEREPRRAVRQAVSGCCWSLAVEIVEDHWWEMTDADLRELPAGEVRGHPIAEVARQAALPDDPAAPSPAARASAADLRSATLDELAERAGDPGVLALLTLLLVHHRRRGDHRSALDLVTRLEAVLGSSGVDPAAASPPVQRAALEAGRTRLALGDFVTAGRVLQLAEEAADERILSAAASGDRETTRLWLARHEPAGVAGHVAVAIDALQALDRQRTRDVLDRLRGDGVVHDELWPFAAWVETEHALLWGGRSRVRAELAALRGAVRRETPWLQGLLDAAEANLCISLGRTAVADRLLADAESGSVPVLLARARLERVAGKPAEALAVLDALLAVGLPSAVLEVETLVLRAWCLDGSAAGAESALERALHLARRDRTLLPFAHVPTSLLDRHRRAVPGLGQVAALLRETGVRAPYDLVDELPAITPRESAVLQALARGLSLEEVGRELFVSRNTVKSQVASLYRKLRARDRTEAVRKASRIGLLD